MIKLNTFKHFFLVTALIGSATTNATSITDSTTAGLFACPDMQQYSGELPQGWHVRFNQAIKSDASNVLQVVIWEQVDKKDKNNFYCRYINREGTSFVLSTLIPAKTIAPTNKQFWKYDAVDDLWECHPEDPTGKLSNSQCAFSFLQK